ncbi:MAG: HIT family protein [Pseudomonadales bacterium]
MSDSVDFALHPQLQKDCQVVGNLPLCALLLMRDANYPWLVLVPRRAAVREWYELSETDQQQLLQETNRLAKFLQQHTQAKKMNIGALGNMVPQLHVHVIARFEQDAAWPAPVWGKVAAQPYDDAALQNRLTLVRQFLADF